jgi:hypothetical protein
MVQLILGVSSDIGAFAVSESFDDIMKLLDDDGRQTQKRENKRPFSL